MSTLSRLLTSKSYSDELNARADALGDSPKHTLAYYENLETDPLDGLSESDLRQIETWMKASENLSLDAGDLVLTSRDRSDIELWMTESENLPLELESTRGLLDSLSDAWDGLCGRQYMRDLENLERELRLKAARAANKN